MNLLDVLKRSEGKTLEFKRDLSSPDGVLRAIVAFANTAGGILLIGVEDVTRHVRGVREPLDVEERLTSLISDSIFPRLVPELEILPWRRTHVLVLQVYPSATRPHYIKNAGLKRGVYVRVGSTNRRADRELTEELRRFARGEAYDEQAMPDLDSEVLDFRAASESFAPVRKLKRSDLETLRLVVKHQGRTVPTVGGMVLFGKERERYLPDAWIQAGRFAAPTKPTLPIARPSGAIRHKLSKRRLPSSENTPCTARRLAPCKAKRTLESAARGRARGCHQRRGACRLCPAWCPDPGVYLRRPA